MTMKLSASLRDALDGGEECKGRDSQLTEWIAQAEQLEAKVEGMKLELMFLRLRV